MSGGAFDYLYYKIDGIAEDMEDLEIIELTKDFAKLVHDAEWYHSGDYDRGSYNESVVEFKNKWLNGSKVREEIIDKKVNELKDQLTQTFGDRKFCHHCKYWKVSKPEDSYGDCKICKGYMKHSFDDACEHFEVK